MSRLREGLRAPGTLVRLIMRDPDHVPERLTIYTTDRYAEGARQWAQRAKEANPGTAPAVLADEQRRRTVSTARINGAIAGTPFFIALVPAYLAYLHWEMQLHLRTAALFGNDPADPDVAADFLVLRGVRATREDALAEIAHVRATPLPPAGERAPLRRAVRAWYTAIMRILVLAGFMGPPEEREGERSFGQKIVYGIRFTVSTLIWLMTWVVPVTFMIVMSWSCENDARRFGGRVLEHYGDDGDNAAIAMAEADRKSGGNRTVTAVRTVLVFVSVALPLAIMAGALTPGRGPLGLDLPEAAGSLAGLALLIGVTVMAVRA